MLKAKVKARLRRCQNTPGGGGSGNVSREEFDALAKVVETQQIKTYVMQEGETVDDAPEWADEVIDPFHDPESDPGGDVDLEAVNARLDAIAQDLGDKLDAEKLPEAINTALAQAKASGVFDGPPGDDYVLTEADKSEIAEMAAGLVEAPGEGEYELIDEYELTAEVSAIRLSQEPDGKPYDFIHLKIEVMTPPSEGGEISVYTMTNNDVRSLAFSNVNVTADRVFRVFADIERGYLFSTGIQTPNTVHGTNLLTHIYQTGYGCVKLNSITSYAFHVYGTGATVFPAGTIVRVEGVRRK